VAASVFIYTSPPISPDPVEIRVFQENPGSGNVPFSFAPGESISGVGHSVAGVHFVEVDHIRCAGSVDLVGRMETDVKLEIHEDGSCTVSPAGSHDASVPHRIASAGGRVDGDVPPGAMVRIVSLSDPPNAVPDARAPDEAGYFLFEPLVAGRYRIELAVGATVLDAHEVNLVPGAEIPITLQAPM